MSDLPEQGPLDGVRVLELSLGLAARTAARLLADLGADVVRVVETAPGDQGWDAETLCGDRGKRFVVGVHGVAELVGSADVFVTDLGPSALTARGLDEATLRHAHPRLVHTWLPPYGAVGRWADVTPDPLLLDAVGGIADHFPAAQDRPVAPVAPASTHLQAALGAAAAVTGLVGRERHGIGGGAMVTGLHACAGLLTALSFDVLDSPAIMPGRTLRTGASFRLYKAGDGKWFFLGALSPDIFLRALDVLDRMDIMVMPGVDGDFINLMRPEIGVLAGAELEKTFQTEDAATWIARLTAASVPAAPVLSREDWLDNPIVIGNEARHEAEHGDVGRVVMPGVPLLLDGHAPQIRHLPTHEHVVDATTVWSERSHELLVEATTVSLSLAGLRVIDLTTFYAGPFAAAVLAEHGADVVKVEPPNGDPYRTFSLAHLFINKRKRIVALDLHKGDGMAVLCDLLSGADVLLDNFRPAVRERLGLTAERLREINPRLVHCSLTAYGQAGAAADLPGFDPVMQALSGMARAQGGDGEPVTSAAPVNDLGAGALVVLGAAVGLYSRARTGKPLAAATSLAAASTFLQSTELTRFVGSPPAPVGSLDHPGPSPSCRYYESAEGWLAIAARNNDQRRSLAAVLGVGPEFFLDGASAEAIEAIEAIVRTRSAAQWCTALGAAGVPACVVLSRVGELSDEFLVANEYAELIDHPEFGRVRGVHRYGQWSGVQPITSRALGSVGCDTVSVLAALGYEPERVASLVAGLVASKAAVAP